MEQVFNYKELRAFSVDFAMYLHLTKQTNCSHEKHKELFDEWIKAKLPENSAMTYNTTDMLNAVNYGFRYCLTSLHNKLGVPIGNTLQWIMSEKGLIDVPEEFEKIKNEFKTKKQ